MNFCECYYAASVSAYTLPTEGVESDGTLEWTATTIVVVDVAAGNVTGMGYTYGHKAVATFIADLLLPIVRDVESGLDSSIRPRKDDPLSLRLLMGPSLLHVRV